jgi:hypothetical protein
MITPEIIRFVPLKLTQCDFQQEDEATFRGRR